MTAPTEQQIRQRAHQLWELAGKPEDREQDFWFEAERELKGADSTDNPEEKSATFTE